MRSLENFSSSLPLHVFLQKYRILQGEGHKIKEAGDPSAEIHCKNPHNDGKGSPRVALWGWPGEQPVQAGAEGFCPEVAEGLWPEKDAIGIGPNDFGFMRDCYFWRKFSDEIVIRTWS